MKSTLEQTIAGYFRDKPIRRAYLFGSHARREARADSDVDILVAVEPDYFMSLVEFGHMLEDLKELLHRDVDLVPSDGLSVHLRPFIEREKVLIYEKAA